MSPFGTFQYIKMQFGLANTGSVYSRILDMVMKEVDRNFLMSHLNDILTYSGEPWAPFGHLTKVVLAHAGCRNQDKTMQNQAVPVQGGVPGIQDQQGKVEKLMWNKEIRQDFIELK